MTEKKAPDSKLNHDQQADASTADASSSDASSSDASSSDASSDRAGTGFFAVMHSVGAAMIGVQSSKNKERDFTHGKPIHFIVGGVIGTLLFLLVIWLLVKYLIATS